jgi:hypothetical protein
MTNFEENKAGQHESFIRFGGAFLLPFLLSWWFEGISAGEIRQ